MKMETKQCTRCNFFFLLKEFKVNPRTGQLLKYCVKHLEKSRQETKCKHGRQGSRCKACGGCGICEHNKQRSRSLFYGAGHICEHSKIKSECKGCGGSQVCEYNKRRSTCIFCGGSQISEHNKIKPRCKDCNTVGHLAGVQTKPPLFALKNNKGMSSTEYLGCNIDAFKKHIEQ